MIILFDHNFIIEVSVKKIVLVDQNKPGDVQLISIFTVFVSFN